MPLHREHARLVVQLLGDVLTDALHLAAAATHGAVRFVRYFPSRQMWRQRLALGDPLVLLVAADLVDLGAGLGDVGVQRLFEQPGLLGAQAGAELLAGGGELQSL
jgi:hypothetical protein